MIKIDTLLRKKFASLDVRLQALLVKDLGFLTLPDEHAQLDFVEKVLSLDKNQREAFLAFMIRKQGSAEYAQNVKDFSDRFNTSVLPKLKKIADEETKKVEEEEKLGLDESLEKAINQN